MPRQTIKDLNLKVDENYSRLDSKIDALREKGGLARGEPSDLIKNFKALELVVSEVITRIENLENRQPWWKFEWLTKKIRNR